MICALLDIFVLELIKKRSSSSLVYWVGARFFHLVSLVVYFCFLKASKINLRIKSLKTQTEFGKSIESAKK